MIDLEASKELIYLDPKITPINRVVWSLMLDFRALGVMVNELKLEQIPTLVKERAIQSEVILTKDEELEAIQRCQRIARSLMGFFDRGYYAED